MPSFSLTPLTDVPPPAQDDFPNFIQFQNAGTDLGTPDADTLNFSTGLTATRGVGEFSNVVTVTAAGAAGASVGVIDLTSDVEDGSFDGVPFPSLWTAAVLVANDSWSFDETTLTLTITETGIYRVIATCSITGQIEGFSWPAGESNYGSTIDGVVSQHYRTITVDDYVARTARWTDQVVIQVDTAPKDVVTQLYAVSSITPATLVGNCAMSLVIERLGDLPA